METRFTTTAALLSLLFLHSALAGAEPELREWTNREGQTINAAAIGFADGKVALETGDGSDYTYDPAQLSDADQAWLRDWLHQRNIETPLPDPAVTGMPGYQLVWSDEFSTDGRPDPDNYGYEHGFVRNNEDQYYREENAFVENGTLVIEARRERVPNERYDRDSDDWRRSQRNSIYTSASLNTRGEHEWLYGRFEMRAKIPVGEGMWPAYWTLGSAREWPACGEIDIMEYYDGSILANTAWGSGRRWQAVWDSSKTPVEELGGADFADRYHIWRMDWDEDSIKLYIDGRLLNETDLDTTFNTGTDQNPFREPHYLLVNLALGGNNGGDASKGRYPARYEIDYLRVYQASRDEN